MKWSDFFRDDGNASMMRLISFVCIIMACILALTQLLLEKDLVALIGSFLSAGILGKATQSFSEK